MKSEIIFSDVELTTLLFMKMINLKYKKFDRELLELAIKEILKDEKYKELLQHCTQEHPLGSGISFHTIMRNIYSIDCNNYYFSPHMFNQECSWDNSYDKLANQTIKSYRKKQKIKTRYEKKLGY